MRKKARAHVQTCSINAFTLKKKKKKRSSILWKFSYSIAIPTKSDRGFTDQLSVRHVWQRSVMHKKLFPKHMSNKNRRDYTLIYKPKVGTPPVTRPLPIDWLSPACSHAMFTVAITAVPRRNRTPCRVNNLPPLATRSRTYLTRVGCMQKSR